MSGNLSPLAAIVLGTVAFHLSAWVLGFVHALIEAGPIGIASYFVLAILVPAGLGLATGEINRRELP